MKVIALIDCQNDFIDCALGVGYVKCAKAYGYIAEDTMKAAIEEMKKVANISVVG